MHKNRIFEEICLLTPEEQRELMGRWLKYHTRGQNLAENIQTISEVLQEAQRD